MKNDSSYLSENEILARQLGLLLMRVRDAAIPTCLVLILLFWATSVDNVSNHLWYWLFAALLLTLGIGLFSRNLLSSKFPADQTHYIFWVLILLNVADGALLGELAWVEPDTISEESRILIITVLVVSLSYFMVQLSPVLPIYFAKVVPMLLMVVSKVWLIWDPAYLRFAIAGVIYLLIMFLSTNFKNRKLRSQIKSELHNKEKFQLIADSIHEMRQPIHAQNLFSAMIGGEVLSPRQREALDHVSITSDLLEDALKPLLDFSRVESGSIEFSRQPFALQPLLNKLERELSPRAEAKGVEYRSRESDLVLNSSRLFIEMILHNLVLNSLRHTEKGDVLVACRKRKKMAILEVWDTRPHFSQLSDTAQYRVLALGIPQSLLKNSGKLELGIAEALILKMGIEWQVKDFPKLGHLVRFSVPLDIEGSTT